MDSLDKALRNIRAAGGKSNGRLADDEMNARVETMRKRWAEGTDIYSGKPLAGADAHDWLRVNCLEGKPRGRKPKATDIDDYP
jgi:hypothetical protein